MDSNIIIVHNKQAVKFKVQNLGDMLMSYRRRMMAALIFCLGSSLTPTCLAIPQHPATMQPTTAQQLSVLASKHHTPQDFATAIGWVTQAKNSLCGGHYLHLYNRYPNASQPNSEAIYIKSDEAQFSKTGYSWLKGHVQIQQGPRQLTSHLAKLWRTPDGIITQILLQGPLIWTEPNLVVLGQQARLAWQQRTGEIQDVIYRLSKSNTTTAWGTAAILTRPQPLLIKLTDATYTTCPPTHNSWQLVAHHLQLNRETGRGQAFHIFLRSHDVPIFYLPYFNFPIDKRRMSGFLYPTFSHSDHSGYGISIPYYLNLAPNYDLTLLPTQLSKRGIQMGLETRYLSEHHSAIIHGHILPHDRAFMHFQQQAPLAFAGAPHLNHLLNASSTRKMFTLQDNSQFDDYWSGHIDFNYVGDDYYLQDFGGNPSMSTDNQLPREAELNYSSHYLHITGLVQSYQTLHPLNQMPIDNVYSREPMLRVEGQLPAQPLGVIGNILTEWTHFSHSSDPSIFTGLPFATGHRLHTMLDLQRPYYGLAGFINPRLRLLRTQYELRDSSITQPQHITRTLPIMSLDSGLFLERKFHIAQRSFHQTLEPRLFYLYSPKRNQNNIPVFDTVSQPFTFDNMFSYNRFSGIDRIADANQFAFAIVTRIFEDQLGFERMRASMGSTYYLHKRRVTLCQTLGCSDTSSELGANSNHDTLSPIVAAVNYAFDSSWRAYTGIAWSPSGRVTNNANFNLQYHPNNHHILNLGYTFIRNGDMLLFNTLPSPSPGSAHNNLNQGSIDGIWPIANQWHAMIHWAYNISHRHSQSYLYGLQYESCCWAFRFMVNHNFKGLNQDDRKLFTNNIYVQWLFKGLGRVGPSPYNILNHVIDGYHDFFGDQH